MPSSLNKKVYPSNYTIAFDDISNLTNEHHKEAFNLAITKFIVSVEQIFGGDSELLTLPNMIGYGEDSNISWIKVSDVLLKIEHFAHEIYMMDSFEYSTQLKVMDHYLYRIYFNTDPVVFGLEKYVKSKGIFNKLSK